MFKIQNKYIGWLQALFTVFVLWGGSNVYMSYVTQNLHVNKLVFAFVTFISCSLCLLRYAGYGKLSKETFRSIDTWVYGVIMITGYFVSLNLFSLMSATESTILQKLSVVLGVIISYIFLARKITKIQFLGVLTILSGVLLVAYNVEPEKAFKVYILIFFAGLLQSLRMFVAEYHKPHKVAIKDNSIKSRCRVIGYVMFVVSLLFGSVLFFISILSFYSHNTEGVKFIVTIHDFMHYPTIISALIMGVFMYAPLRFLEFSITEKIKTENFLALGALTFFSTLFWEWATQGLTNLPLRMLTPEVMLAGVLITVGALIMSISKIMQSKNGDNDFKKYLKVSSQDLESVEETREIIANTLEHFNSDLSKTAKALGVTAKIIEVILEDKDKVLAFNPDTLRKVAKKYRKNVATADALTGLLNKGGFMTALKAASFESDVLSLFFIDLNKFKPVNDTYGHVAGDYVLKIVAQRLQELFPDKSLITRLGGDEYCILLLDVNKEEAEEKINSISAVLEQEMTYKNHKISISGSIGLANYPADTKKPEELIKLADKQMYVKKDGR